MHNFANPADLKSMERLPQPFRMIATIQAMSHVKRYGLVPCFIPQTDADHTGRSVMLAFAVAQNLGLDQEETLNIVQRMAFHDGHEVILTDIPHPVKHMNPELADAIADAESDVENIIFSGFTMPFRKPLVLPKARLLSCVVDTLDLVLFSAHEVAMHNIHHVEILRKGLANLELYSKDYERFFGQNILNPNQVIGAIYFMANDLLHKVDNALNLW